MPRASGRDRGTGSDAGSRASPGQCRPSIRDSSAHKTDQRTFLAILAAGVSRLEAETAKFMDELVFCFHYRWGPFLNHEAVYRATKTCLTRRFSIGSIRL